MADEFLIEPNIVLLFGVELVELFANFPNGGYQKLCLAN